MNSGNAKKLFYLGILLSMLLPEYLFSESCLTFVSPKQGKIVTSSNCTLLVEASCKNVRSVELQARYFSVDADTPTITSLGIITRPPYKFMWDISQIPNQLLSGVAFLAEATLSNNQIEATKREGVFFVHQPITRQQRAVPYEYAGTKTILEDTIAFESPRSPITIASSIYWNEKDLSFVLEVKDPLFYANMSRDILASLGLEILIDPAMSRKPFPHKDILVFSVPLHGKPYKITYKPVFDETGSFKLSSSSVACGFDFSVTKEDFKGFKIYFSIPLHEFSGQLPKELGCNLIVKTLKEGNTIARIPWIKGNQFEESYSPFLWGTIRFQPKPLYKNRILVWSAAFITGLLLTFLFFKIVSIIRNKPHHLNKFEKSEAEQQQFDRLKEGFERRITQKEVPVEQVARDIKIAPKKLNLLIKKFTGMSFQNYIMFSRIEIAKERLRSSHCSEASIAEACGFEDANEMEKYFIKFCKTTPYKFRSEQQVA